MDALILAADTADHRTGRGILGTVWILAGLGALPLWYLAPAPDTQGILASTWQPQLAAV